MWYVVNPDGDIFLYDTEEGAEEGAFLYRLLIGPVWRYGFAKHLAA